MKLCQASDRRSWRSVRRVLESHCRVATVLEMADGHTAHIRQSSSAEHEHQRIYDALGVSHATVADGLRLVFDTLDSAIIDMPFFTSDCFYIFILLFC